MDLSTLRMEVGLLRENLEKFFVAVNAKISSGSQQEIDSISISIEKLFDTCETCHKALSELSSQKLVNNDDPIVIELWDLTKAFEYTRRKYEAWLLTKKRELE